MTMTVKMTAMAIVLACFGYAGAAAAQQAFTPLENDFVVAFAAPPTVQREMQGGKDAGGLRRYVAEQAGETFVLTIDQYPAHIQVPVASKAIYERLIWAHAHDVGMTFVSDRPALLSNLPCWEGTYRTADGKIEVRRILMLGDSVYQLSDVRPQDQAANVNGESFFGSFKITASALTQARNIVGALS
jgi:hypothetical protein